MRYRTVDSQTLDEIVWRQYKSSAPLEAVLEANPGLAAHGPILPAGIVIELPTVVPPKTAETIRLWD